MNQHLVSIVLPVYNGARFLCQSVDSILSQTYTNFELIIVDDCSTDETPGIIEEYARKDRRVRTIRHSQNQYLPQALNTGFDAAKGVFFTWTSDDNIYKPNAIKHLVDVLVQRHDVDLVYGNESIIDDAGHVIEKSNAIASIGSPEEIPILSCVGGYFLFRSQVYFDVGGYESKWFLVEDWQFWLKSYNAGKKFVRTEDNHYLYRDNTTSLSMTKAREVQERCLELSLKNLRKHKSKYTNEIAMRAYLKCVGFAYRLNDKKAGIACLDLAQEINRDALSWLKPEIVEWLEEG